MRTPHEIFREIHTIAMRIPSGGSLPQIAKLANEGGQIPFPSLTPAQQHAHEMLAMLKHMISVYPATFQVADIKRVIEKIEPKPPTLDEALQVLSAMEQNARATFDTSAIELLNRARAAGLL